jgi:tRNA (cytidine/uridine-2'-O-)-methyltransferase
MHIALFEPEIPQNTGNVVRTCSATGAVLHLIEPLGFDIGDKKLKRAGLDYWHEMDIRIHAGFDAFIENIRGRNCWFIETVGSRPYHEAEFAPGDCLLFGKETTGLPEAVRAGYPQRCLRLPMLPGKRSLNLSNTVAVVLYEALRQNNFGNLV